MNREILRVTLVFVVSFILFMAVAMRGYSPTMSEAEAIDTALNSLLQIGPFIVLLYLGIYATTEA